MSFSYAHFTDGHAWDGGSISYNLNYTARASAAISQTGSDFRITGVNGLQDWSTAGDSNVAINALVAITESINLEIAGSTSGSAAITFSVADGLEFFNGTSWVANSAVTFWQLNGSGDIVGADVVIDASYLSIMGSGEEGFELLLHEVGHALGLFVDNVAGVHPDDVAPTENYTRDSTIMAYDEGTLIGLSGMPASTAAMLYDIAVLQHLYGAKEGATGNSTYEIIGDKGGWSLWDGGGEDIIDASELDEEQDIRIDLRGGLDGSGDVRFSVVGERTGDTNAFTSITEAFSIAYQGNPTSTDPVVIEHAIGGSGDDVLIGNQVGNRLEGGDGDDIVEGGDGNDTLIGGDGEDSFYGGADTDLLTYKNYSEGLYFDLDAGTVNELSGTSKDSLKDTVSEIEIIEGTAFDDVLRSSEANQTLMGGIGNDSYIIEGTKDAAVIINDKDGIGSVTFTQIGLFSTATQIAVIDNHPYYWEEDLGAGILISTPNTDYYLITIEKADEKAIFTYVHPYEPSDHGVILEIENFAAGNVISETFSIDSGVLNFSFELANPPSGDDTASGGSGDDSITPGTEHSHATGGLGADNFILLGDRAYDLTITDFTKVDGDLIDITGFDAGVTNLAALDIVDDGSGNAQFTLPQGSSDIVITLTGVTYSAIDATYFLSNTLDYGAGSGLAGADDAIIADTIYGSAGNDTVWANDGNDIAYGHTGHDIMYGWLGSDSFWGGYGADSLYGDQGADQLNGDFGNDLLYGGDSNDTLIGGAGNDSLIGETGGDGMYGGDGNDTLNGGDDGDWMEGGAGDDVLFGGLGADGLVGGDGADIFKYNVTSESAVWNGDWIYGFAQGEDKFDLSVVVSGISVIGTSAFSGTSSAELRQYAAGSNTVLALDSDGNGVADMEFVLVGSYSFAGTDLL